jgi:c(7)-type cytochrome triheme protein
MYKIKVWLTLIICLCFILLACSAQKEGRIATGNLSQERVELLIKQAEAKSVAQQQAAVTPAEAEQVPLSTPQIAASEAPRNDGIHDPKNNNIDILQDPTTAMADFPRDRRKQVDWVKAIEQGLVKPRADLLGESEMMVMDLDIIMKNTQMMPWVRFPHKAHTQWLACDNCHPAIFEPQEHANPITMNKVLRGEYCGVCHDKVAFALFVCERCHSVPHEGSGPKWW